MSKQTRILASLILLSLPLKAADRLSIDVKVSLEAAACTPTLSNGGVVNFGTHPYGTLSPDHYTQLGTRNITLTVTCESATGIAITARDTRVESVNIGEDTDGKRGVKYALAGSGYIADPTRLFGLGTAPGGGKIGSYAVLIDTATLSANNGSEAVDVEMAGADAVFSGQRRTWQSLPVYPLPVDQSYYYTFVKKGELTPTPVMNATIPLQVSASVANNLGGREKIELDGQAVISVVYL